MLLFRAVPTKSHPGPPPAPHQRRKSRSGHDQTIDDEESPPKQDLFEVIGLVNEFQRLYGYERLKASERSLFQVNGRVHDDGSPKTLLVRASG